LSGKTVVLYVGYFVARKGLHHLIQAFQAVAGEHDVLALVGSGPQEKQLRAMGHGDQRTIFPGYLEGAEKASWYAAADLFVLPTLHDPWGLVVNEAMAFGLPIIVTDAAGCARDLVQDNGLVVPAGDVDALATALARLLPDEALRRAMGQRSQHIISLYTVKAACDAFLQVIDDACQKQ
jgi:glycosyltransferase involved in cell wall biosynthesis